jgi:hypothetical protein
LLETSWKATTLKTITKIDENKCLLDWRYNDWIWCEDIFKLSFINMSFWLDYSTEDTHI